MMVRSQNRNLIPFHCCLFLISVHILPSGHGDKEKLDSLARALLIEVFGIEQVSVNPILEFHYFVSFAGFCSLVSQVINCCCRPVSNWIVFLNGLTQRDRCISPLLSLEWYLDLILFYYLYLFIFINLMAKNSQSSFFPPLLLCRNLC